MPRYVILFHELPSHHERDSHWDFMLEESDYLLTWALDASPLEADTTLARELPNHRLKYLTSEGPVAGDRGAVKRIDAGQFEWLTRTTDTNAMELRGGVLKGVVRLTRETSQLWCWTMERFSDSLGPVPHTT